MQPSGVHRGSHSLCWFPPAAIILYPGLWTMADNDIDIDEAVTVTTNTTAAAAARGMIGEEVESSRSVISPPMI